MEDKPTVQVHDRRINITSTLKTNYM
jgi:hypothetical protein